MKNDIKRLYKYFAPVVDDNDEYETVKRILNSEIVFKKEIIKDSNKDKT